jgi:hypothetical protein
MSVTIKVSTGMVSSEPSKGRSSSCLSQLAVLHFWPLSLSSKSTAKHLQVSASVITEGQGPSDLLPPPYKDTCDLAQILPGNPGNPSHLKLFHLKHLQCSFCHIRSRDKYVNLFGGHCSVHHTSDISERYINLFVDKDTKIRGFFNFPSLDNFIHVLH